MMYPFEKEDKQMHIMSTNSIRYADGSAEFENINQLINNGKKIESQFPYLEFLEFKHGLILFPDKIVSSSAMVEVDDKTVSVGIPGYYYIRDFEVWGQAVIIANNINVDWLESSLSAREWLDLFNWDIYSKGLV